MIIRPVNENDLPELARLAAKTYIETFGYSFTEEELGAQIKETRSEKYFCSAIVTDTILLAFVDKKLAGYIQLSDVKLDVQGVQPGLNDQAINAIYIHSDFQRQGIGKALMDAAFNHPRLLSAGNVFIDVWDKNERALQFYKKYGFSIVGTCSVKADGKIVGKDLVLMRSSKS